MNASKKSEMDFLEAFVYIAQVAKDSFLGEMKDFSI
jgi:hypothetical protein